MPDKLIYEYAVIRFVPRVEREEFLNVGVILFCKRSKYLDVKYHIDEKRIKAMFPEADLDELASYLKGWELICQGNPTGGPIAQLDVPSRFRWLTATRSTIIQSGKVHPGLSDSPATVLAGLFDRYVR